MANKGKLDAADLASAEVDIQALTDKINSGEELDEKKMASLMKDPVMLAALQAKLEGLEGTGSGYMEDQPKSVKRRIKALKKLQSESIAVEVAYQREIQKLDRIFAPKFEAIYKKRASVVSGTYEPTDEECVWVDEDEDEEEDKIEEIEEESTESETDPDNVQGCPKFWLSCLMNNQLTSQTIEEYDVPCLESLVDVKMEYSGVDVEEEFFKLSFFFEPNEYFTNEVLTKVYFVSVEPEEDELMYNGPSYEKAEGCKIEWKIDGGSKSSKDLTKKTIKKKQRKKGANGQGKTRTVTRQEPQASFFTFFAPPSPPDEDDETEDEELLMQLHAALYQDFELADAFKEKIVPNAVMWYTGEALDFEEGDDEDDDEDDYGMNDEDGNSEDEEDEEADPDYVPSTAEKPPECKQS